MLHGLNVFSSSSMNSLHMFQERFLLVDEDHLTEVTPHSVRLLLPLPGLRLEGGGGESPGGHLGETTVHL